MHGKYIKTSFRVIIRLISKLEVSSFNCYNYATREKERDYLRVYT